MKSSVRFMDGQLLDATLYGDNNEIILNLTHNSRAIRNCLIGFTDDGLQMFKIVRKVNFRHFGIRYLLNELTSNLDSHYHFTFKGVVWGVPEISYDNTLRVFALNGTILFREDGYIYPAFQQSLDQQEITTTTITNLLSFLTDFSAKTE